MSSPLGYIYFKKEESTPQTPRRRALFTEMTELPLPPQPSIVRWGTWLHAANYYAQNFEKVKQFIAGVSEDSVAVSDAKDIFKNKEEAIKADLINVASNYNTFLLHIRSKNWRLRIFHSRNKFELWKIFKESYRQIHLRLQR